jgi:hypothetical protein
MFHPKCETRSSYDDGSVGGDSPRLIKLLFGELDIMFFDNHSDVFCEEDFATAVEDNASSKGDVTPGFVPSSGMADSGFISGAEAIAGKRFGSADGLSLLP